MQSLGFSTAQAAAQKTKAQTASCQQIPENIPANVDMKVVRNTWLGWYNGARKQNGLGPYVYNDQLDRTAMIWSEFSKKQGSITHKRPGQKKYYDYKRMVAWFQDLGLQFANVHGETFVENINWGYYPCSSKEKDCTQAFIKAIRTGYDFFMREKGKKYHAHYDSIMNKGFKEIGLGIAVDPAKKKYYLTVHYGTKIVSNPKVICGGGF